MPVHQASESPGSRLDTGAVVLHSSPDNRGIISDNGDNACLCCSSPFMLCFVLFDMTD